MVIKKAKKKPKASKQAKAYAKGAIHPRMRRTIEAARRTSRALSIEKRLRDLGKSKQSERAFDQVREEIGHAFTDLRDSPKKKVLADAKRAYDDSILNCDDIADWIAAARKAAKL